MYVPISKRHPLRPAETGWHWEMRIKDSNVMNPASWVKIACKFIRIHMG
jgi:hypothetical protein